MKKRVYYQCDDCSGTGLYSGMCEGSGHAVVCLGCNGTGRGCFEFTPFKKRRGRRDIKTVSLSRGRSILLGCGPKDGTVTYKEFIQGKLKA